MVDHNHKELTRVLYFINSWIYKIVSVDTYWGHHLPQWAGQAFHVQRLCPRCSGPGFESRPGALCCVSLPLFLIPFPVASSAVLSIIMKKKDTYWCTRSCAYVLWITAGCFSSPLLSCKAFSYRFVACLRNVPLGWSIMTAGHSRHHSVNIWHFIACLLICSFLHSCLFNPFFSALFILHIDI